MTTDDTNRSISSAWRGVCRQLAPPLAVCILVRLVLCIAAIDGRQKPWTVDGWIKWDAVLYLSIAQHGVKLTPHIGPNGHYDWFGTTDWLPGFPAAIRAAMACGLPPAVAALWVTAVEQWIELWLIWELSRKPLDAAGHPLDSSPWLTLIFAGFFPAAIYQQAPFPNAQVTLFLLVQLILLLRFRPVAAGLAGAVASFSHPSGVFAAAAPALGVLLPARPSSPRRWMLLTAGALSGLGFLAVLVYDRFAVGMWDAFFKGQTMFSPHAQTPFDFLSFQWLELTRGRRFRSPSVEAMFASIVVVTCVLQVIKRRLRGPYDRELLPVVLVGWLMPMCITIISPYRSQALLAVAALLLADLRWWAKLALCAMAIYVAHEMAWAYFKGNLM